MISVGISSYNQQDYLPDAIESVLAQTVPCEIIVVNDGSTDNSLEIAKSYESKGVKVIDQVNKGLASARNTAIMNMTGDYYLPLDADDMLLENCIEKMEIAIRETKSDVIAPSFKMFGTVNQEVILDTIPTLDEFKVSNRIPYFSAIKKELLLEVGGYQPKMKWGYEDFHIWIDIFKRQHGMCMLQEVLVLYRTKEFSMINVANEHHGELMDQMRRDHPTVYHG